MLYHPKMLGGREGANHTHNKKIAKALKTSKHSSSSTIHSLPVSDPFHFYCPLTDHLAIFVFIQLVMGVCWPKQSSNEQYQKHSDWACNRRTNTPWGVCIFMQRAVLPHNLALTYCSVLLTTSTGIHLKWRDSLIKIRLLIKNTTTMANSLIQWFRLQKQQDFEQFFCVFHALHCALTMQPGWCWQHFDCCPTMFRRGNLLQKLCKLIGLTLVTLKKK